MVSVLSTCRRIRIVVRLALALVCVAAIGASDAQRTRRVKEVVDGDTVHLVDGERVRLLGIDTPERGDTLYREATRLLESLVLEQDLVLEFGSRRRDSYKRLLAHLWCGDTLVSEAMLRSGLARLYVWPPDTLHFGVLLAAQTDAREAGRGVWSMPPPPPEPFYVIHLERMRFHRPGCTRASRKAEKREMTRDRLLDLGYSACRNCKP